MRGGAGWLGVCVLLALALPAHALTTPLSGAVAWPNTVPLELPFPAGTSVYVTSGYGPSMGSSLHAGLNSQGSGNDYYALDLVYADQPNGGLGLPVVAALGGTVVLAGWATAGWANFGQRVALQHDIGDGHSYVTHYAHLDSIDPAMVVGATVTQGQVLGALGQSCDGDNMQLDCPSFGPHLHFGVHRQSSIGGSGTGGSYGGNAVVPEPLSGYEDLLQGQTLVSTNGAADCPTIPPEGAIIDESDALCFSAGGTAGYWHIEAAGYGDSLRWTIGTDVADVDNYGVWRFDFAQAGSYSLEVYTAAAFAQSQSARYRVTRAGQSEEIVVDQSAADGWQTLGSFDFAAGADQALRLDDVTGEPLSAMRQLVFDAVRILPAGAGSGGAGGTGDGGNQGGDTASSGGSSAGDEPDADEGCGCEIAGRPSALPFQWSAWLLLLAPWLRRSRKEAVTRARPAHGDGPTTAMSDPPRRW